MPIYIDVLLCLNFTIDYFLLSLTARLSKLPSAFRRRLVAAVIGAVSSLVILLPEMPSLAVGLFRLSVAALMVWVCFAKLSFRMFAVALSFQYISAMLFSGCVSAFRHFFNVTDLHVANGAVYYRISAPVLVVTAAVIYAVLTLFVRFKRRNIVPMCNVRIADGDVVVTVSALIDSGNKLKEPFSQKPVMVIDKCRGAPFKMTKKPRRVIPYGTVSGGGMLNAFLPDSAVAFIKNEAVPIDIYVAVSNVDIKGDYEAVLPYDAI